MPPRRRAKDAAAAISFHHEDLSAVRDVTRRRRVPLRCLTRDGTVHAKIRQPSPRRYGKPATQTSLIYGRRVVVTNAMRSRAARLMFRTANAGKRCAPRSALPRRTASSPTTRRHATALCRSRWLMRQMPAAPRKTRSSRYVTATICAPAPLSYARVAILMTSAKTPPHDRAASLILQRRYVARYAPTSRAMPSRCCQRTPRLCADRVAPCRDIFAPRVTPRTPRLPQMSLMSPPPRRSDAPPTRHVAVRSATIAASPARSPQRRRAVDAVRRVARLMRTRRHFMPTRRTIRSRVMHASAPRTTAADAPAHD